MSGTGLLVRFDIHKLVDHKLVDVGCVAVTPDYQCEASDHIHTDCDDGRILTGWSHET